MLLSNYTRIRYVLIFKIAHYNDCPDWMKWDNLFIHQSVTYRLLWGEAMFGSHALVALENFRHLSKFF